MLDRKQFKDLIVVPTLLKLKLYSKAAEELVLGTALQESHLTYLKQLGGGPALGVFQMEPATHDDIWDNFLTYRNELGLIISELAGTCQSSEMTSNLAYACAMCRVHYFRVPDELPAAGDIAGQATYWKRHYNTPLGAGTVEEYMENWQRGNS